jgi:hypothetical protein
MAMADRVVRRCSHKKRGPAAYYRTHANADPSPYQGSRGRLHIRDLRWRSAIPPARVYRAGMECRRDCPGMQNGLSRGTVNPDPASRGIPVRLWHYATVRGHLPCRERENNRSKRVNVPVLPGLDCRGKRPPCPDDCRTVSPDGG